MCDRERERMPYICTVIILSSNYHLSLSVATSPRVWAVLCVYKDNTIRERKKTGNVQMSGKIISLHTHTHTQIYIYIYTHTHTQIYIYTHTHTYICMCSVCVCVYIYIYICSLIKKKQVQSTTVLLMQNTSATATVHS